MSVKLTIPIKVVPKGRPRFNRRTGSIYTPEKTRDFDRIFKLLLPKGKVFEGPVGLIVEFGFAVSKNSKFNSRYYWGKPDLDNCVKSVMDSCNGVLWRDDCQVSELVSRKVVGFRNYISIECWELKDSVL